MSVDIIFPGQSSQNMSSSLNKLTQNSSQAQRSKSTFIYSSNSQMNMLPQVPYAKGKKKQKQFIGRAQSKFISQRPTEQIKKERRNKDRLQHLFKLLPHKQKWQGYLDIGCGNAEITAAISQKLRIDNVYGVDVFPLESFVQPQQDRQIIYQQNVSKKLDLDDSSVELITCFMAIHHFEKLHEMIKEIRRTLLPNGFLFIREHDVPQNNQVLRQFIEEMHRKFPDHPTDGYIRLFSREELRQILTKNGFEHIGDSNYRGSNPQAVYHSLYTLKGKDEKKQEITVSNNKQFFSQNQFQSNYQAHRDQIQEIEIQDEEEEQGQIEYEQRYFEYEEQGQKYEQGQEEDEEQQDEDERDQEQEQEEFGIDLEEEQYLFQQRTPLNNFHSYEKRSAAIESMRRQNRVQDVIQPRHQSNKDKLLEMNETSNSQIVSVSQKIIKKIHKIKRKYQKCLPLLSNQSDESLIRLANKISLLVDGFYSLQDCSSNQIPQFKNQKYARN